MSCVKLTNNCCTRIERLVQVLIIPIAQSCPALLRELCCDDPIHLVYLSEITKDLNKEMEDLTNDVRIDEAISKLRAILNPPLDSVFELPQYRQFMKQVLPLITIDHNTVRRLILQTSYSVLKKLEDSVAFKTFMNDERSPDEM